MERLDKARRLPRIIAGLAGAAGAVLAGFAVHAAVARAAQDPLEPMVWPEDDSEAARIADSFALADHDRGGWVSFEEAAFSMNLDRDGFALFDADRDGRIPFEEFDARYREVIARGGAFPLPRGASKPAAAPTRDAAGLLSAYDRDLNGALSQDELDTLIGDYAVRGMNGALALGQFDGDGSGRLERPEVEYLAAMLAAQRAGEDAGDGDESEPARSLTELFGTQLERPKDLGSVPAPPRIAGPVLPFGRLDLDGSGSIDAADLDRLQFPLTLAVRPATVLATLDRDGDGAISAAEFRLAFEPPAEPNATAAAPEPGTPEPGTPEPDDPAPEAALPGF